jgi:hypothetical protein
MGSAGGPLRKQEACPVCGESTVSTIGERTVKVIEPPSSIQQAGTNVVLKYVLACDSVTTETKLCLACRHIYLSPTFEEGELDRLCSAECVAETKRQYREFERVTGQTWAEVHGICQSEQGALLTTARRYRPKRLHELVINVTGRDGFGRVLDFGAYNGELISCFTGSRLYVFDKELSTITDSEVIPITSIEELASNGPYDLVVLSHVLEHVPYPTQLLESLREITHAEGVIYVEVPLEYCGTVIKRRAIPLGGHVNYFSRSSLLRCLRSAGFGSVRMIRREIAPYGECQGPVLKSIASATPDKRYSPRLLPWPVDLLIDAVLTVKSRKWPTRFV